MRFLKTNSSKHIGCIVINDTVDIPLADATVLAHTGNFHANVLRAVGYEQNNLPAAELLRSYYQLEPGYWLIASPIFWEATHNDAMVLSAGKALQVDAKQSHQWFEAFEAFIQQDGMQGFFVDAETWLVRCDGKPPIYAKPVDRMVNQSMMPELQGLDESLYWQRFITESQMWFNQYALNQKQGASCMNGIWLWGGGALKEPITQPIYCQNEPLKRLASFLSNDTQLLESNFEASRARILLCESLSASQRIQLEQTLKNKNTHWLWNNVAYQPIQKSWWSRLWS